MSSTDHGQGLAFAMVREAFGHKKPEPKWLRTFVCGAAIVVWLWCGNGIVIVVVVWQWYRGCGVAMILWMWCGNGILNVVVVWQ